jgi:hypothetical protein
MFITLSIIEPINRRWWFISNFFNEHAKKTPTAPQLKSKPCHLPFSMVAHLVHQADMRYTVPEKSTPTTRNTIA